MAVLPNAEGSLRLELLLADIEMPVRGPQPAFRRLLARAAVEHYDQKDGAWWPFVRMPAVWLGVEECRGLVESLEALVRGESEGLAFRSQVSGELGLQLGLEGEGFQVEAGFDLHRLLADLSGREAAAGDDLALFRFRAARAELVRFASDLKQELGDLLARG